jgi:hypothetical protein
MQPGSDRAVFLSTEPAMRRDRARMIRLALDG